jgi:hypothetical protein
VVYSLGDVFPEDVQIRVEENDSLVIFRDKGIKYLVLLDYEGLVEKVVNRMI